ncbi:hypothetical protein ACH4OW_32175 [Streptomyces sp. NPDC017056]|uniref:hypothetical protein n=1 Tax=Streptomyces sp. NPDC017056 TaxID=3364973 RepID=UPI00379E1B3E
MTQSIDLEELAFVAAVMERAHRLLVAEEKKLPPRTSDGNEGPGSPNQTLLGAGELTRGADDAVRRIALAIGYACAGLHPQALRATRIAHFTPRSVPGGADRMARPLSSGTIEALKLVRQVAEFFGEGLREAIDKALAAPGATWPPANWKDYDEERMKSAATAASASAGLPGASGSRTVRTPSGGCAAPGHPAAGHPVVPGHPAASGHPAAPTTSTYSAASGAPSPSGSPSAPAYPAASVRQETG